MLPLEDDLAAGVGERVYGHGVTMAQKSALLNG